MGYIDDFFLQGNSHQACCTTVLTVTALFRRLGFTIHPDKSFLTPSTKITFLGVVLDSKAMTITLTEKKKAALQVFTLQVLRKHSCTIRTIACLIGHLVASLPASLYGALYYRSLEIDKNHALAINRGNFDAKMSLSARARFELTWWTQNISTMFAPIQWPPLTKELAADASGHNGWGATLQGVAIGGAWKEVELALHINVKEMLAIFYALRSFVLYIKGEHVRVLSDNTTAVLVLNKMGTTRSPQCQCHGSTHLEVLSTEVSFHYMYTHSRC